jgi:gluconate 2-dehydrogenase alpha chain
VAIAVSDELKKTDVVIVGLGAAGGIAAYVLTRAGLNVIGLEAGGRLTGGDEKLNELAQPTGYNVFGRPKFNLEIPTWRPTASTTAIPASASANHAGRMMNAVGGTSIHYGTECWRLSPWHFKSRSETIKRYGVHAIPAGSTLADWPLTYEELEPYYDKVEYEIGVSGKAGNIRGKLDPAGNIFEGARDRQYPLPPLRGSGFTELMSDAAKRLNWHPFPTPSSAHSQAFKGTSPCLYCSTCYNGCFISAKGSTDIHVIPAAEATGKLSIVTQARVTQVNTDNNGRVTGVHFLKGEKEFFQPASVVMLAAFVYENVRLLLLSTSKVYPKGLSNNHGQVGKNYMSHNSLPNVYALFPGRRLNIWSGLSAQGINISDWTADQVDHSGLDFIGGGKLNIGMGKMPIGSANMTPPSVPTWGSAWKSWLRTNANSVAAGGARTEMLSYEDNYLDLDPAIRDSLGFPVIRVTFNVKDNEKRLAQYLTEKVIMWFKEAGATETWVDSLRPASINVHAFGGTRMGTEPESSVVDRWCFSHEAPNLAILSSSVFPTSSEYNPTETIQALAWWTADHLVENWKTIAA